MISCLFSSLVEVTRSMNINIMHSLLLCIVPKPLTLYTLQWGMGKRNKVVKLTERKIQYIIRAKKRGESTKRIAVDMKLSESTVKRVWMH